MGRRIWFLAGLLILGILFSGCVQKPAELQPFSPEGGGFSILLPGTPTYKPQTVDTAAGPMVVHVYTTGYMGKVYTVNYNDWPEDIKEMDPQVILDGARDGAVANVNGTLLSEAHLTLDGYPGQELNISTEKVRSRSRYYLVGKRFYEVMVAGPVDESDTPMDEEVLDSFQITG